MKSRKVVIYDKEDVRIVEEELGELAQTEARIKELKKQIHETELKLKEQQEALRRRGVYTVRAEIQGLRGRGEERAGAASGRRKQDRIHVLLPR